MEKTKKAPNRIREERKDKNMNIDELAKMIGVSRATINNYETGTHDPKLTTWKALSDIFDVPIGYLQGVSDVKNLDGINIEHDDDFSTYHISKPIGDPRNLFDIMHEDFNNKRNKKMLSILKPLYGKTEAVEINNNISNLDDRSKYVDFLNEASDLILTKLETKNYFEISVLFEIFEKFSNLDSNDEVTLIINELKDLIRYLENSSNNNDDNINLDMNDLD